MRVFVTGGAGFIGRYVVRELLEKGYDVTCLVREQTNLKDMPKGVQFVFGDITKKDTLKGLNEGMDYVVHLAAMGHVSAVSEAAYQQFVSINEEGTRNLIEEFRQSGQLKKFVQFSSTAAMGPIGLPVLDENSKPNPLTPYQKSKYRSECVMREAFEKFSFPSVVVRPCMVYGPGGQGEFHKFCRLMKKGIFPKVGRGKNLTPLVHVQDIARGAVAAMEQGRPGQTYLLASSSSIPMDEMRSYIMEGLQEKAPYLYIPVWAALCGAKCLEVLCRVLGKEPPVTYRNIKSTVTDRTFDISKAKAELGYAPQVGFREGILQTVAYYKQHGLL